jgi:hypothetical protein
MIFTWYKIYDLNDFDVLDVPRVDLELNLESKGIKTFSIFKGVSGLYSVLTDDVFLTAKLNNREVFSKDGIGVYVDDEKILYVGYEVEE